MPGPGQEGIGAAGGSGGVAPWAQANDTVSNVAAKAANVFSDFILILPMIFE
jgi:hypothetical protein